MADRQTDIRIGLAPGGENRRDTDPNDPMSSPVEQAAASGVIGAA